LATQRELRTDEIQARDEAAAQVQAAAARVLQAQVTLAEAQLRLERMTVRAPVDGRVYRVIGHPGSRVGGSAPSPAGDTSTVVTLYRPESLQVRVDVRFEDLPQVSADQPVRIENPALSAPLIGRVLFVGSEADIQKNTLQVKLAFDTPPAVLKPEMLVDITFLAPRSSQPADPPSAHLRLYVPRRLVQQDEDGSFVWLADQSAGVARKVRVQTGAAGDGDMIEVLDGLTAASRLIAGGTEQLRPGERIRVMGEAAAQEPSPAAPPPRGADRAADRLTRGGNR
jgi:RND family efflux transporter MFP subunit